MNLQPNSGLDQEIKGNEATLTPHEVVGNIIREMPKAEFEALLAAALKTNDIIARVHGKSSSGSDYDGLATFVKRLVTRHYLSQIAPGPVRPVAEPVASAQAQQPVPAAVVTPAAVGRKLRSGVWALPNVLARCNWATASKNPKPLKTAEPAVHAQRGALAVSFGGTRVTQVHLTLVLELIRLCCIAGSSTVEVVPGQVIKGIGRTTCKKSYTHFRALLQDLQHASIQVDGVGGGESHAVVPKFTWRTAKGDTLPLYRISLAPLLLDLVASREVTYIDTEQRLAVGNGLAAWLHAFVCSHREHPHGYSVETLISASGTGAAHKVDDRIALKAAIATLIRVGVLTESSRLDPVDGLVYLDRVKV